MQSKEKVSLTGAALSSFAFGNFAFNDSQKYITNRVLHKITIPIDLSFHRKVCSSIPFYSQCFLLPSQYNLVNSTSTANHIKSHLYGRLAGV